MRLDPLAQDYWHGPMTASSTPVGLGGIPLFTDRGPRLDDGTDIRVPCQQSNELLSSNRITVIIENSTLYVSKKMVSIA